MPRAAWGPVPSKEKVLQSFFYLKRPHNPPIKLNKIKSHFKYYSVVRKNEIILFAATWMQLVIIIVSKASQKEKDKYQYHTISVIHGI